MSRSPNVDSLELGFLAGNQLPSAAQVDRIFRLYSAFERAKSDVTATGKTSSDNLGILVKHLVDCFGAVNPRSSFRRRNDTASVEDCCFTCKMCDSLCNEPLTIPCGHTFCRTCLEKDPGKCIRCGSVFDMKSESISTLKTNILLLKTIEKWFPKEAKAVKLKHQGNLSFSQKKFDTAARIYSKAIEEVDTDHLLFSNRSFAYLVLGRHQEALQDAETVIHLKPDWAKGYYRKGAALSGLQRHSDAMIAYLECLTLDASITAVQTALKKVLDKILIQGSQDPQEKPSSSWFQDPQEKPSSSWSQDPQEKPSSSWSQDPQEKPSPSWFQDLIQGNNGFLYPRTGSSDNRTSQHPASPTATTSPSSSSSHSSSSHLPSLHNSTKPMTSADRISLLLSSRKRSHDSASSVKESTPTKILKSSHGDTLPDTTSSCRSDALPTDTSCPRCRLMSAKVRCKEDFECSLCFRLMFRPVTTPCGHSFCLECLYRCLDYRITCPLCKSSLTQYLAERRTATTVAIDTILETYFPEENALRKKQQHTDLEEFNEITDVETSTKHKIPTFVCALAYPRVPCPLHIFEPRNRLMIRRCFESPARQFGMCITLEGREDHYEEYGCLLRIRNQQYLPDGRSVLDTIGGPRFRVLGRQVKDGYYVSEVEFVKDTPVEPSKREELQQLNNAVYKEATRWFQSLPPVPHTRILQHFGAFPALEDDIFALADGPAWVWWLTAVLPIDKRAQYSILAMLTLRERLVSLHKFIMAINRRWTK